MGISKVVGLTLGSLRSFAAKVRLQFSVSKSFCLNSPPLPRVFVHQLCALCVSVVWLTLLVPVAAPFTAFAQKQADSKPQPPDPVTAEREGKQFVAQLLSQRPEATFTNATLIIRDADRNERRVPIRFETTISPTNWTSIYRSSGPNTTLRIVHTDRSPNAYFLSSDTNTAQQLAPADIMSPFASSDFWPADLGLEFLHWPTQHLIKKEMYSSRFCNVLESSTSDAPAKGYSRVRAWFTAEAPHDLVRAEGYDRNKKRIKVFDVSSIEKVQGQFRVESVEMRDRQHDSRTIMEFK